MEERARDGGYRIAAIPGRECLQEVQTKIYRMNWPDLDFEKESNADFVPHSELAREKMWSRIHLIPMLQAEEDRDQVRRHLADKARERELLGAETKVYHSDRYVLPHPCLHHRLVTNVCLVSSARHLLLLLTRSPSRWCLRHQEDAKMIKVL